MRRSIWMNVLVILVLILAMTGCGADADKSEQSQNTQTDMSEGNTSLGPTVEALSEQPSSSDEVLLTTEFPVKETITQESEEASGLNEYGLTKQQMNSFAMLYYLAITAEDIRTAKDNKLYLEDIYTSLLNDINPGAIDEETQDHLRELRDVIYSYIDDSVKRERLQYIYNQNKAAAIRSAVPNPLSVISVAGSLDWKRLAVSAVYTIVDSYTSYKNASDAADKEFIMNGWELDDNEIKTIRKNRDDAFDYMVDIVQQYGIDGKLTLNEKSIEDFVEICHIESNQEKIRRLQSEEETYKLLGNYWLELANCYFEAEEYENCLECVDEYQKLSTGIYRKDFNYVRILPKAIVAVQEICSGDECVEKTRGFADQLIENTATEEWSVRYFAAQVYLDLYAKTQDKFYLDKAYEIAYDNVTILLSEQRKINSTYLEDVKEVVAEEPDYKHMNETEKKEAEKKYKEDKKQVKKYNETLKKTRETELPSLYEPLIVNCELLFGLADEKGITPSEKGKIEEILQSEKNGIFLSDIVNNRFSFTDRLKQYSIGLSKDKITIPVSVLIDGAVVSAIITDSGETTAVDDIIIKKVERDGENIDSFSAIYTSKTMKSYKWTEDSKVTITIDCGENYDPISFDFIISEYDAKGALPDKVVFEQK